MTLCMECVELPLGWEQTWEECGFCLPDNRLLLESHEQGVWLTEEQ